MAVRINFDDMHNPLQPILVLANKGGNRLGAIPATSLVVKSSFTDGSELTFDVDKTDCEKNGLASWNDITDFKTVWAKDWNALYEIRVTLDDGNKRSKNILAVSLGQAELSQIMLFDIEINTDDDILRDDYIPSVLYNPDNEESSILGRIFKKAPHYNIKHVDDSIKNIQRSFSFNEKSIYDATNEIAKEIECIFIFDCGYDEFGEIQRDVSVYDLKDYCLDCGERGTFNGVCQKCGSTLIKNGYGEDTSIFVSTRNLADSIQYSTNVESVKNCFRLEAGDDLMTATIASCNPNGTEYIWYIPDEIKSDMSQELVSKLESYDLLYAYYQNEYNVSVEQQLLEEYNALIDKYSEYSSNYSKLPQSIVGYPALMQAYYDTIDFSLFLSHDLMPSPETQNTTAQIEAGKLNYYFTVAVRNIDAASKSTVDGFVLAFAKTKVDPRYKVTISESSYDSHVWIGKFTITNYSNENDTVTTDSISYGIDGDYELYVKQLLEKSLRRDEDTNKVTGIAELFDLDYIDFISELKKYSLSRLNSFRDSCISCLDIMTEQGVSNSKSVANDSAEIYQNLYTDFYSKLSFIEEEILIREYDIAIVSGKYEEDGSLLSPGVQSVLNVARKEIQSNLNFEEYLGESLAKEFSSYRREDKFSNSNYISDGLNNAEIFQNALQFIESAKEEIYKSANLQHSIKTSLKNLLTIKEFMPIVDHFEVGNWIRVLIDGVVYKLRLTNYEISFDDLSSLSVDFSDVLKTKTGYSDLASIIDSAANMASSYDFVARQAKKGSDGNNTLSHWVNDGLSLTQTRIVNDANNQNIEFDKHGLTCKRYIPELDSYDDKQLKIINSGLYLTDDAWRTAKAGIGNFIYYNPMTSQYEEGYGVIADTIVGNLILSKEVGIYNESNSITMDENGFSLITDVTSDDTVRTTFTIQRKSQADQVDSLMYLDSDGNLVINGSVRINTAGTSDQISIDEIANSDIIASKVKEIIQQPIYDEVTRSFNSVIDGVQSNLDNYRAEVGQYMTFSQNGLTIGAEDSPFKTVIDNTRMAFTAGDTVVSYISGNQLYINDAVINHSLLLGKFYFLPRENGAVSLTWQG